MESYILRIYRYNSKRPDKLIGTIEGMEFKRPFAFSSLEELWMAIQGEHEIDDETTESDNN